MKLFVAVLLAGALVASAAPVVVDQHDMHADSGPLTAENALVRGSGQGLTAGRLGFAFLRPPPYRQCAGSRKQRAEGRAVAAGAGRRRRSRLLALSKQELGVLGKPTLRSCFCCHPGAGQSRGGVCAVAGAARQELQVGTRGGAPPRHLCRQRRCGLLTVKLVDRYPPALGTCMQLDDC